MKRTGFTTVIALTLLAMITAALSAIAIGLHAEAKRTQSMLIQAELRQLLMAGGSDVIQRAEHWPPDVQATDWSIDLPADLALGKLTAQMAASEPQTAAVVLTARINNRELRQTIKMSKNATGWHAQGAELGELPL